MQQARKMLGGEWAWMPSWLIHAKKDELQQQQPPRWKETLLLSLFFLQRDDFSAAAVANALKFIIFLAAMHTKRCTPRAK